MIDGHKGIIEQKLEKIDYREFNKNYIPGDFALEFIIFIKMVTGGGEGFKTPPFHYAMLDAVEEHNDIINIAYRGSAKTSIMAEYMILFIAVYNRLPGLKKKVRYGIFVGDTMENSVKNIKKNLESRWRNSDFLQMMLPKTSFNDKEWTFINADGVESTFIGYGVITGIRGNKRYGMRPQVAIIDDIISDEAAESPTMMAKIKRTISRAIEHALDKNDRKIIWSGTPFSENDPLYSSANSGAYYVNVFPACNHFDENTTEKDYVSSWEDGLPYKTIKRIYDKAKKDNDLPGFYQELMLKIITDETKQLSEDDIHIIDYEPRRSDQIVITTDWAVSQRSSSDYSIISVWAIDGDRFVLIDGFKGRETMDILLSKVIEYVRIYSATQVTMEANGQQEGFIHILQNIQMNEQLFFNLVPIKHGSKINKIERISKEVIPMFKMKKIFFSSRLIGTPLLNEAINELTHITSDGVKSKHDDFLDTIVSLGVLSNMLKTSNTMEVYTNNNINPKTKQYVDMLYNPFNFDSRPSVSSQNAYSSYLDDDM